MDLEFASKMGAITTRALTIRGAEFLHDIHEAVTPYTLYIKAKKAGIGTVLVGKEVSDTLTGSDD